MDARELLTPDGRAVLLLCSSLGRNKVVYGLADAAVVVSSEVEEGGTWAGAIEALKAGWGPVFVRAGAGVPRGNAALLRRGAAALPEDALAGMTDLPAWLQDHRAVPAPAEKPMELFPSLLRERAKQ